MERNKYLLPDGILEQARELLKCERRVFLLRREDDFRVAVSRRLPPGWTLVSELRDYDFYTEKEIRDNQLASRRVGVS